MKVGAATQPLGGTSRLGQSRDADLDDLASKLKDLDPRQLEELVKAAQTYGPKVAMQLAQQMAGAAGGMQTGDFNLSDINGSKPRGTAGTQDSAEDFRKLLEDIRKKQEAASPSDGAQGAGTQQQQYHMPQDVLTLSASAGQMSQMY